MAARADQQLWELCYAPRSRWLGVFRRSAESFGMTARVSLPDDRRRTPSARRQPELRGDPGMRRVCEQPIRLTERAVNRLEVRAAEIGGATSDLVAATFRNAFAMPRRRRDRASSTPPGARRAGEHGAIAAWSRDAAAGGCFSSAPRQSQRDRRKLSAIGSRPALATSRRRSRTCRRLPDFQRTGLRFNAAGTYGFGSGRSFRRQKEERNLAGAH